MRQEIAYALLALALFAILFVLLRRMPRRPAHADNLRIDLFHGREAGPGRQPDAVSPSAKTGSGS